MSGTTSFYGATPQEFLAGEFPVVRLFGVARFGSRKVTPQDMRGSDVLHYSIPNVQDFGAGAVEDGGSIQSDKIAVTSPCILISRLNPRKSTVVLAEPHPDLVTVASAEFISVEARNGVDNHFLAWVLKSQPVTAYLSALVSSTTNSHQRAQPSDVSGMGVPWPDSVMRSRIVAFLDRETGEIDEMLGKLDALAGVLETRRAAEITKSVLGEGRVGTVPLWSLAESRPSNVDKKIVDGEKSVRLVNYTDVYYNSAIHPGMELMEATASDDHISRFRVLSGDVIITKDSETPDDIGIPALVETAEPGMVCAYPLTLLRPREGRVDPKFLYWFLESTAAKDYWLTRANGVTRCSILTGTVDALPIPDHPLRTQRAIADHLDDVTGRIDAMLAKVAQLKAVLTERRAVLITDVVTGKKELP